MNTTSIVFKQLDNGNSIYECEGTYGKLTVVHEEPLYDQITQVFETADKTVDELISQRAKSSLQVSVMFTWYDENTLVIMSTTGKRYTPDANGVIKIGNWLIVTGKANEELNSILVYGINTTIDQSKYTVYPKGSPIVVNFYKTEDGVEYVDIPPMEGFDATENIPEQGAADETVAQEPVVEEPVTESLPEQTPVEEATEAAFKDLPEEPVAKPD